MICLFQVLHVAYKTPPNFARIITETYKVSTLQTKIRHEMF